MLSIIIPTLNEENNIIRLIDSIKKNTTINRKDYEIIVVDGGSKDNTFNNAKKLADKAVYTKKRGIGIARNIGAKYSKGDLLLFIDADVIIDTDVLTYLLDYYKNIGCRICGTVTYKSNIKNFKYNLILKYVNLVFLISNFLNVPQSWGAFLFIDKKTFQSVGGFKENIDGFEDSNLVRRVNKFLKFKILKEQYIFYDVRRFKKLGLTRSTIFWLRIIIKYHLNAKNLDYPTIEEL